MSHKTVNEVNTTVHQIDLIPYTKSTAKAPYRAGLNASEIEQAEVKKMLDA